MLRFDEVEKAFEGRPVIGPTTLEVADGERLALIGPSGCGKSTLLKMVVGLVIPDRGRVYVGDVEVTQATAPDANPRARSPRPR